MPGEDVRATAAKGPHTVAPAGWLRVLASEGFADYALIDSGNGRKLERFGRFTVDRPEPQAMWQPVLAAAAWQRADAVFKGLDKEEDGDGGRWRSQAPLPESWPA